MMETPADKNIKNLTGRWTLNKTESDDYDQGLILQGLSWLTRKTVQTASVTVSVRHFVNRFDTECVFINQTLAFGVPGSTENRYLDWQARVVDDRLFGTVTARSRRITADEMDRAREPGVGAATATATGSAGPSSTGADAPPPDLVLSPFLKEGWDPETRSLGLIHALATNDAMGWTASQVWGFATVKLKHSAGSSARKYVRRVRISKPGGEHAEFRMVYDFVADDVSEADVRAAKAESEVESERVWERLRGAREAREAKLGGVAGAGSAGDGAGGGGEVAMAEEEARKEFRDVKRREREAEEREKERRREREEERERMRAAAGM